MTDLGELRFALRQRRIRARREAVRKCLEEAAHTSHYMNYVYQNSTLLEAASSVSEQRDHIRFWCNRENLHGADFLFTPKDSMDLRDLHEMYDLERTVSLRDLVERVREGGSEVYIADLTTSDVGRIGFRVVRAVAPAMHPMFFGFMNRSLAGRRLHEVPIQCGFSDIPARGDRNSHPHPFP